MLQKVRNTWIKGVLEHSLYTIARLDLGLSTKPDAVQETWDVVVQRPDQPQRQLPPGTRISSVFDEFGGSLLVLGDPGTGKTTMLLELAKDLLERAEIDSDYALPVVFNLSSWAVRRPPLIEWLVDELFERYQVPRKHAKAWVGRELILPLLDGLDEVAAEHRSGCVAAINTFRKHHGLVPLAVCSRAADYEALPNKLNLSGGLVLQSLTREQTNRYLIQTGEPLAGVRAALQEDDSLWELLDTPLMLNIATLAYQNRSAADVGTAGTLAERKRQLYAEYTSAMFKRRGTMLPFSYQKTVKWLAWLASEMALHNQVYSIWRECNQIGFPESGSKRW